MNREKIKIGFNLNKINAKKFIPKIRDKESSSENEEEENYKNNVNDELFSLEEKNENLKQEVFNYDEEYDKIQLNKKIEKERKKKNSSQIKYMNKIIEKAELRKIERNKNILKVEKEKYKNETGKNLDDLPVFITQNYQKKLNEINLKLNNKERDDNDSYFEKNDDIQVKDFEKRKKEYQRNLKKVTNLKNQTLLHQ